MARGMRIFYASDIHGSERCFLKFLGAAKFYGARVLILGGDITGKVVVPLIHRGTGYEANFLGRMHRVESAEEIEALEKAIRFNGFYPVRLEPDEYEAISADELRQSELFRELVLASLRRWVELAEERLKGLGVRCFVNPGNDDEFFVDEVLGESDYVENMDGGVARIDEEHEMVVVGYSNQTPFDSPREMPEEELERHIVALAEQLETPHRAVFTLHVPPYGTGLDHAPLLRDGQVVTRGGHTVMTPVGSTAVRRAIEQFQPLLGLHGHVHESRGARRLGKTLCINPGSEYGEGVLHGAIVNLARDKVHGYQLVTA
ncbi:metallophosphoesterase family protein [Kyrpidia spormannii]|uniref:Metallophosphoesterase n=1 Tax=Kyrpidia spormannii TaxID=2055160 RepID=A0A6F9E5W9_9BACL|nr:metallophosphoesterase [Kyrpidia spormannii]CAB3392263.1 Metallophosphoesterase [Kyrpidia spormannii]